MDKVHWRLANDESNRLEVSFTDREFSVEEFQPLSHSVDELAASTATSSSATTRTAQPTCRYSTRATKRQKLALETEEKAKVTAEAIPPRLWPSAQRARIWFCREQLLTLDCSANDAVDSSNVSENDAVIAQRRRQQQQQQQDAALHAHRTLNLIGYHTPQLVHCTLFASTTTTPITAEGAVAALVAAGADSVMPVVTPQPRYIAAEALTALLKQTRGTLQTLDLVGLSPYSTNPQAYEELQQTLQLCLSSKYALLDIRYASLANNKTSRSTSSSANASGVIVPLRNGTVLSLIPPPASSTTTIDATPAATAASPRSIAQSQWVRTLLLGSSGRAFDADDNLRPQLDHAATVPASSMNLLTSTLKDNSTRVLNNIITAKELTTKVRAFQLEDAGFLDASMGPILSQFAAASAAHPHRLLYLRLDIVLCVATVTPMVELLLTNGRNLGLLGLGLLQQNINKTSASAKKHDKSDDTMETFRELTRAIGISRVDNVKMRIDNSLVESNPGFMTLCTDMLRYNYACSHFDADFFGRTGATANSTPNNLNNSDQQSLQEVSVVTTTCSDNWKDDTAAFLQMNCRFRQEFLTGFDPEFTASEGWVRLVENIKSVDLPPEHSLTCLYLCLRQYPNAISNQLLYSVECAATTAAETKEKGKDSMSSCSIKDNEHLQRIKKKHLKTLQRLETEVYKIGCTVSSSYGRIVMLEKNLAKTKREMVEMLIMMADLKQVSSGPHARPLGPRETDLYRRVAELHARLEANRDFCLESITPIRVDDVAHNAKIAECKRLIRNLLRE